MKELSLNILDIAQNSIRAEADEITIAIRESVRDDLFRISITDNGKGIPEEILANVTDPFVTTRTKRRMGLGLPLLKYHAELAGGKLEISSESGNGTEVVADFSFRHFDRQPLGDIVGVLILLIASNEKINFIYMHITDKGRYRFSSLETKEFLETETLNDRILLEDLRSLIVENLKAINASEISSRESCSAAF
jgi:anti-sigma regulatory factor (Ser/Thr protein kinase)